MAFVELDTCFNPDTETIGEVIVELVRDLNVTGVVAVENGPGGGWPIVCFDGPREQLARVAARYHRLDETVARVALGERPMSDLESVVEDVRFALEQVREHGPLPTR